MNYDNPAVRLLAILQQGKSIVVTTPCKEGWNILLDTAGNQPMLMARLGKVMELPHASVLAIQESFPEQGNIWAHWFSKVDAAFQSQNLLSDWNSFIAHIDEHTLTYLKIQAALLQARSTTKLIPSEDLIELRETFNQLMVEIMNRPGFRGGPLG